MDAPSHDPLAELRDRVLSVCARILAFGGLPLVALVALQNWLAGLSIVPLVVEGALVLLMLVNLRSSFSVAYRSAVLVVGVIFVGAVATVVFGPTMGTGMFYFGAVFICGLLLHWKASVAVILAQIAIVVALWFSYAAGVVTPQYMPDGASYVRIILSSLLTSGFAAVVIWRFVEELQRALLSEREAREAQAAAHREQQRAAKAAEEAQRLEALGRLAGGVAHDVNNALAIIQGNLAVIQSDLPEAARQEAYADIERGVSRASDTTRQLVNLVQPERSDDATRPSASLTTLIPSVSRALPASIELSLTTSSERSIAASQGQFEQAMLNLILNARDAMPDGGRIQIDCVDDGDDVVVSVTDEGTGIAPSDVDRLFEPFFTTKGNDGTGVGLTMVWGFVVGVGGTVDVTRPEAGGARFVLRFPGLDTEEESTDEPRPTTIGPRHVLLLEDQALVRRSMVRMLGTLGFTTTATATTGEAIEAVSQATFDLFITDGHVPDAPVRLAIDAFRKAWPGRPVILCTGNPTGLVAVDDGDIDILQKPFTVADLQRIIATSMAADTDLVEVD